MFNFEWQFRNFFCAPKDDGDSCLEQLLSENHLLFHIMFIYCIECELLFNFHIVLQMNATVAFVPLRRIPPTIPLLAFPCSFTVGVVMPLYCYHRFVCVWLHNFWHPARLIGRGCNEKCSITRGKLPSNNFGTQCIETEAE